MTPPPMPLPPWHEAVTKLRRFIILISLSVADSLRQIGPVSKDDLQGYLLAACRERPADQAGAGGSDRGIRIVEARMIESVEHLPSQHCLPTVGDVEIAVNSCVQIEIPRPLQDEIAGVSEVELRGGGEGRSVKPVVNGALAGRKVTVAQAVRPLGGTAVVRILGIRDAGRNARREIRARHHAPDSGDIPPAHDAAKNAARQELALWPEGQFIDVIDHKHVPTVETRVAPLAAEASRVLDCDRALVFSGVGEIMGPGIREARGEPAARPGLKPHLE